MEIWIGLAHVRPWKNNNLLRSGHGALVPVVGLASSPDDLASVTATLLYHHRFDVIEVTDIELLSSRLNKHTVEDDLLEIAKGLYENNRVGIGAV